MSDVTYTNGQVVNARELADSQEWQKLGLLAYKLKGRTGYESALWGSNHSMVAFSRTVDRKTDITYIRPDEQLVLRKV